MKKIASKPAELLITSSQNQFNATFTFPSPTQSLEAYEEPLRREALHASPALMELLPTHLTASVPHSAADGYRLALRTMRNAGTSGAFKDFSIFIIIFYYTGKKIYTIKFSAENTFSQQGASSNCHVCTSQTARSSTKTGNIAVKSDTLLCSPVSSHPRGSFAHRSLRRVHEPTLYGFCKETSIPARR